MKIPKLFFMFSIFISHLHLTVLKFSTANEFAFNTSTPVLSLSNTSV